MALDPFRTLRLRMEAARDPEGDRNRRRNAGLDARSPRGTPRFIGRVVVRGAAVAQTGRVFLVHPVQIDGPESEAALASAIVDSSRLVPVVFVGGRPPAVGELVVVHAIDGRWTAAVSGPAPSVLPCGACSIPRRNLSVSWTNGVTGSGVTALAFDGFNQWLSGCAGSITFRLACDDDGIVFSATFFPAGDCPNGLSQTCSSATGAPNGLALVQQTCSPFLLTFQPTAAACPGLAAMGYQQFAVTA